VDQSRLPDTDHEEQKPLTIDELKILRCATYGLEQSKWEVAYTPSKRTLRVKGPRQGSYLLTLTKET
jgi:hypothetical protein